MAGIPDEIRWRIVGGINSIPTAVAAIPDSGGIVLMRAWMPDECFDKANTILNNRDAVKECRSTGEYILVPSGCAKRVVESTCAEWNEADFLRLRICIRVAVLRHKSFDPAEDGPIHTNITLAHQSNIIYAITSGVGSANYTAIQTKGKGCKAA